MGQQLYTQHLQLNAQTGDAHIFLAAVQIFQTLSNNIPCFLYIIKILYPVVGLECVVKEFGLAEDKGFGCAVSSNVWHRLEGG